MTVITKLSDRDNLIFECIKVILVNKGNINAKQLQWELFQSGIYCRGSILKQALAVMKEKGDLTTHHELVQKEESEAGV